MPTTTNFCRNHKIKMTAKRIPARTDRSLCDSTNDEWPQDAAHFKCSFTWAGVQEPLVLEVSDIEGGSRISAPSALYECSRLVQILDPFANGSACSFTEWDDDLGFTSEGNVTEARAKEAYNLCVAVQSKLLAYFGAKAYGYLLECEEPDY